MLTINDSNLHVSNSDPEGTHPSLGVFSIDSHLYPHAPGVWRYRCGNEAACSLTADQDDAALTRESLVHAVADVVDVKPQHVETSFRRQMDAGKACSEGNPWDVVDTDMLLTVAASALKDLGSEGEILSESSSGGLSDKVGEALKQHLGSGATAIVMLGASQTVGEHFVAVVGYDPAKDTILLFDPVFPRLDGWYPWHALEQTMHSCILARVPEQDRYSPRNIFRQIYGVGIAGFEQRWPDIDLEVLRSINPDCIGWMHFARTPLSYPIVKEHLENSYYFGHNFSGEESIHGAISLKFCNQGRFTAKNLVIGGHNMRDNSMFGFVTAFRDDTFCAEKRHFDLLLGEKYFCAFPVSAYPCMKSERDFDRVTFADDAEFMQWVEAELAFSIYPFEQSVSSSQQMVTFYTCYRRDGKPFDTFVVHAVLQEGVKYSGAVPRN